VRAGKLDKLVVFQQRAATLDAYGQRVGVWVDVASAWASVRPANASEKAQAREIQPTVTHEITVRYDPRLAGLAAAGMRIVYAGRVFNPGPPRDTDEANASLVFDCVEGVFDGD
jgi:SPP1 family predicted phage head-tail adaptor